MGTGIQICGLNGCGKSTLGKALAQQIGFRFIDAEDLYFSRSAADEPYINPKSRDEVEKLLTDEVTRFPDFVFAAVKGDYGTEIVSRYRWVVVLEVPEAVRMQRVRNRSFQKFGSRMLPGGDLYHREEAFFRMAASRREEDVGCWLQKVNCPIIRVDGTKPIDENTESIIRAMDR